MARKSNDLPMEKERKFKIEKNREREEKKETKVVLGAKK